ncbi:MAG: glycosyltransferase family 39 protein [Candidatus Aenigmarchaeota archaeon]|nr:glycosyltransferase family 39 protein [Candidatus Aenigmarchaeota archaeon]
MKYESKAWNQNVLYAVVFIAIFLLAAYLRLSMLDYETLGPGEVELYEAARDYASGNIVKSFYIFDTPPLSKYILALILIISGFSETALRLFPAIFGMLAVVMTYFFAKKFYSQKIALLSTIFIAFSFIHLQMSRYVQLETATSFFFLLAFYYFFDFVENRKKNYLLFGATVALGMLIKFTMFYAIASIVLIAVTYKYISFRRKPQFSITIDNFLLKSLIVAVVLFFLIWPYSLVPVKTDITLSVEFSDGLHTNHLTPSIPQIILVLGKRSASSQIGGVLSMPFGYFLFFLMKENIIFLAAFFLGLFAIIKKPKKIDKMILLSLVVFMLLLWAQKWGFTYRYLAIVIPLIAIIAARCIDFIKSQKIATVMLTIFLVVLATSAFAVHTDYIYYKNFNVLEYEPELFQSEGMKESISYIKENCPAVYTDSYYHFILAPYHRNVTKYANETKLPTCVLKGYTGLGSSLPSPENVVIDDFIKSHSCELKKSVVKKGVLLQKIYYCS